LYGMKAKDVEAPAVRRKKAEFGVWAHNMGLLAACSLIVLGIFGILWRDSGSFDCKVGGRPIAAELIRAGRGVGHVEGLCTAATRKACCDPDGRSSKTRNVGGGLWIGLAAAAGGCLLLFLETFRLGGVLVRGLLALAVGVVALGTYATCLAGVFAVAAGLAWVYAKAYRREDDLPPSKKKKKLEKKDRGANFAGGFAAGGFFVGLDGPTVAWLAIYFGANAALFAHTLATWIVAVQKMEDDLEKDDVRLDDCDECPDPRFKPYTRWRDECQLNEALVRQGPLSYWAPIAKAAGVTLNLNCALLVLPVTKNVVVFLNDTLASGYYREAKRRSAWFDRVFRSPSLASYLPFLTKHVDVHVLIAKTTAGLTVVHVLGHFFNYWQAPGFTQVRFAKWGWFGTTFLTGAVALAAMFVIFSAAAEPVRRANFEIFWVCHHAFVPFFLVLFLHGPTFFYWCCVPLLLYAYERYSRVVRGNKAMLISRVEWIPPVLAVHFRPVDKHDFLSLREGTYVSLNCPFVSKHEWHPFTVSSARGDLFENATRVAVDSGEEVVPAFALDPGEEGKGEEGKGEDGGEEVVPAAVVAASSPSRARGGGHKKKRRIRYCPVSSDASAKEEESPVLLEAGETAYHDYVSVHVKVQEGDETWTSKFKDYLEMLAPRREYPFHFTRRDDRGDLLLGRRLGPDSKPILRVDGPHAAPAMHYAHYGTVMVCGAGIGMTPCASILTGLLKYRWRKNFKPEIVHFCWVVAHPDVKAFEWFVRLIADLEYHLLKDRTSGAVANRNYVEIHVFVTRAPPPPDDDDRPKPPSTDDDVAMKSKPRRRIRRPPETTTTPPPVFTAEQLFAEMLAPATPAKRMGDAMSQPKDAPNRFQDAWVWNGRPDWHHIFTTVKAQRQHRDVGVCFCGTPLVGHDLARMCSKFSSEKDDCVFTLHKEK